MVKQDQSERGLIKFPLGFKMFNVIQEFKSMGKVAGRVQINDHGRSILLELIISKNNSFCFGTL